MKRPLRLHRQRGRSAPSSCASRVTVALFAGWATVTLFGNDILFMHADHSVAESGRFVSSPARALNGSDEIGALNSHLSGVGIGSAFLEPLEPRFHRLCDLLEAWPPGDPQASSFASRSVAATAARAAGSASGSPLPIFNLSDPAEGAAAAAHRRAEVPFVLVGVPELDATASRWAADGGAFLRARFRAWDLELAAAQLESSGSGNGSSTTRVKPRPKATSGGYTVERSATAQGHFLYYKRNHAAVVAHAVTAERRAGGEIRLEYKPWVQPQETVREMTYGEFEVVARAADDTASATAGALVSSGASHDVDGGEEDAAMGGKATAAMQGGDVRKLYLTINAGVGGALDWIASALPFFKSGRFFRADGR